MATAELQLAPDHPAAQGHFPGNPVIPGAVLLAETLQLIAPKRRLRVRNAKFLAPARPGDRVAIEFESTERGATFTCRVGGTVVMKGEILWTQ